MQLNSYSSVATDELVLPAPRTEIRRSAIRNRPLLLPRASMERDDIWENLFWAALALSAVCALVFSFKGVGP